MTGPNTRDNEKENDGPKCEEDSQEQEGNTEDEQEQEGTSGESKGVTCYWHRSGISWFPMLRQFLANGPKNNCRSSSILKTWNRMPVLVR